MGRSKGLALGRSEMAFAVIGLVMCEVGSAVFRDGSIFAIVGRSSVFRIQRIACQFSFVLRDRQLTLVLGSQLFRREAQITGRVSRSTAHTESVADFDGTRAGVAGEQYATDRRVQFVIGRRVGTGEGRTAAGTLSFRIAVACSLATFRTIAVPMSAPAVS
eukprot:2231007-Pleurochrysis_carterae.AAC.1